MADVTEKLKDLANLLEKGLITREEFDEEKASLRATARLASTPPTSSTNPGSSQNINDSIGAYYILGELGQGGMGVVVRGKHRSPAMAKRQGGEVAIKVLHAQYAQDIAFRDRFEREASMGLKLDHPGVVKVHDLVIDGGNLALVMDLAEGRPLSEVIGEETGPIPWDRAWPMFKQILAAVAYAHEHNVVHRDIKPENVIVSPSGQLQILDFGIAKDMEGGKTKTGTGMGTVNYMAPEQYTDAKSVDERADIYALGMTLYEMLAGRLPWEPSVTEFQVMTVKSKGDFPPPTEFYPDIPPGVVEAVQKAVEVEQADRFTGVAAMAKALEEAGVAPAATAPEPPLAQPESEPPLAQSQAQPPVVPTPVVPTPVVPTPVVPTPLSEKPAPVVSGTSEDTPEKSKGVSSLAAVLLLIGLVAVIGSGLFGDSSDEQQPGQIYPEKAKVVRDDYPEKAKVVRDDYPKKAKAQPTEERIIEDLGIPPLDLGLHDLAKVVKVPSWDVLNVRAGPSVKDPIVAELEPNTRGVKVLSRPNGDSGWWLVSVFGGIEGWASSNHLELTSSKQPVDSYGREATLAEQINDQIGAGEAISRGLLTGLSCQQLWVARNFVYARHGYAFTTQRAQNFFGGELSYSRRTEVTQSTIHRYMTVTDGQNRDLVVSAEEASGCR